MMCDPTRAQTSLVALYSFFAVSRLILEVLSRSFHRHRIPARRATAVDPAIALGSEIEKLDIILS